MTTALNPSDRLNPQFAQKKEVFQTPASKISNLIQQQGHVNGLFKDVGKCFKLANFWTKCLTSAITESSDKMTQAGRLIGNYCGIWELPRFIAETKTNFQNLETGTAETVAEFASSFFGVGKSFFDGIDLAGTKFGLLSSKVVTFFSPLNPIGTLVFAANEVLFKNIPSIQSNWKEDITTAHSSLFKLVKHVALTAIGFLTLVAAFFKPICALWVIPTLSTISVVSSISGRFFDTLALPSKRIVNL